MSRAFDVLIEGGGIYGATAACEASRRGLSWLLVERDDFGAGASSASLKIAHGGLRYLQSGDLRRSFESIRERRRLLRAAPRWLRPLPCRLELADRGLGYRTRVRAGLVLNDLFSLHRNRGVQRDRQLPRSRYPVWYDALIEDTERLLWAFLHSAERWSRGDGVLCNHARVERRERDGDGQRVWVTGLGEIHARAIVRCIGASRPGQRVMLAMNLLVDALPLTAGGLALALAHPEDGRNLFLVPWRGRTMIGTYNRHYPHPPEGPLRFEPGWIDEFLRWAAPVHPALAAVTRERVRFVHAGVLPRAPGERPDPAERAWIRCEADGSIDVQGVKWTTAWGVAAKALDAAERALARRAVSPLEREPKLIDPGELLDAFLAADPQRREAVLPGRSPLRRGEVEFALERERARDLADVLLRRTGTAATGHPGTSLVCAVADLLQRRLDWSERERRERIEAFHADFRFAGNVHED